MKLALRRLHFMPDELNCNNQSFASNSLMNDISTIQKNCNVGIAAKCFSTSSEDTTKKMEFCTTQLDDSSSVLEQLSSKIVDHNDSVQKLAEKLDPPNGILSKITFDEMYHCLFSNENGNERDCAEFLSSRLQEKDETPRVCNKLNLTNELTDKDQVENENDVVYGVSVIHENPLDDNDDETTSEATIEEALNQIEVPDEFKGWLRDVMTKHQYTFNVGSQRNGNCSVFTYRLLTTPHHPFTCRPYRLSEAENQVVEEQVKSMLQSETIRPSNSPYRNPIFVIWKKDGTGVVGIAQVCASA